MRRKIISLFVIIMISVSINCSVLGAPLDDITDNTPGAIIEKYKRVMEIDSAKVKQLSDAELTQIIKDAEDILKYCREHSDESKISGLVDRERMLNETQNVYNNILAPENVTRRQKRESEEREREDENAEPSLQDKNDGAAAANGGISKNTKGFDEEELTPDSMKQRSDQFLSRQKNLISNEKISDILIPIARTLVAIGSIILVIVTILVGLKYMTAGPKEQGKLKQRLIILIIATIAIMGAQGIWALVLNFMKELSS